jgi:hypothetical protein
VGWMQLAEDEVQLGFFEQVNETSGSLKIGKFLTGSSFSRTSINYVAIIIVIYYYWLL